MGGGGLTKEGGEEGWADSLGQLLEWLRSQQKIACSPTSASLSGNEALPHCTPVRQGKREEEETEFFKFMGLVQHLNSVFLTISGILFQVTSVFVEHLLCAWPFISPFRSSVSWTQGMMSFWSSVLPICYFRSTWAAVEHLSTVFLSFIHRDDLLQPAVNRGRHGACFCL